MPLKITLTDDALPLSRQSNHHSVGQPPVEFGPGPAFADVNDRPSQALLLYLADEPEIGQRFTYGGADWEIVDYQDGWIARLIV